MKQVAMLMLMLFFAVSCSKKEDTLIVANVSGNIGGHDYVDLGLPSGTLWATCNVGTDSVDGYNHSPELMGDYYAWGEIYRKLDFFWDNYKYYESGKVTKYCETDSLIVLESEDDIACRHWLNGWHIPTKEQWEELVQNTTSVFSSLNGVKGRFFTAANGNSLFLPCTGTIEAENPRFGNYWSSSVCPTSSWGAWEGSWRLYFDGTSATVAPFERCFGFTIRPVYQPD